jgi:hypothetical protein|tara:strand:+ start:258 stop:494 length:237 start_codon:yes stop_codon:yes gene_type:complete
VRLIFEEFQSLFFHREEKRQTFREKKERETHLIIKNGSRGHRHRPTERVHERLREISEKVHETRPTRVHAHREQNGFW